MSIYFIRTHIIFEGVHGINDDDALKSISDKDLKGQLSDTTDIKASLVLAPPTKRHMHREEMGNVNKLFTMPSINQNTLPNERLVKNYQRNLTSRSVDVEDFPMFDPIVFGTQFNQKRTYSNFAKHTEYKTNRLIKK